MQQVFFDITDCCNHRCGYCCKNFRSEMMVTASSKVINSVINLDKGSLIISGGEPGLCKDLVFNIIYEQAHKKSIPININTNLTLWTIEDLDRLSKLQVSLTISVPSLFKSEYSQIVGRTSTYDWFIYCIKYVVKKLNCSFVVIINEINIETFPETLKLLKVLGVQNVIVQPRISNHFSDLDDKYAYFKLEKFYYSHRDMFRSFTTLCNCNSLVPCSHVCKAGKDLISVLSNGDVVP